MLKPILQKRLSLIGLIIVSLLNANGQSFIDSTTFRFGGYVKTDFINTWYQNGDVGSESAL